MKNRFYVNVYLFIYLPYHDDSATDATMHAKQMSTFEQKCQHLSRK